MRAVVIVNPLSGRGRYEHEIRAHAQLASDFLKQHGLDAVVRPTRAAGDANRFAREAVEGGAQLVIAWGGDGTINEAACAMVHSGIPLGIVPAGSGNGLATDLGLPFDPMKALLVAASGRDVTIDAGRIHQSIFFNIAGIGIDAVVSARFAERGLRRRGPLAYLQIGINEVLRYRTQRYAITIDGSESTHDVTLLAFANGRQYGNNVCIAPGACLDDGLLEMVLVEKVSTVEIARRLPSLFLKRLKPGRGVAMRAVRAVVVKSTPAAEIPFHVDGEPRIGPEELSVAVIPAAVIVRVPADSRQ